MFSSAHQEREQCGWTKAPEALEAAGGRSSPPALGCPADNTHTSLTKSY